MVGLARTKIFPPGWAEHHRPVAAATMTAECTIRRINEGPPPYPLPDDWEQGAIIWTGQCRVQELKRENSPIPGDQPTELRQYLLTFPFKNDDGVTFPADIRTGERGDVAEAVGRVFNLKQSMAGSLLWEHDFVAWENQTQQQ